LIVQNWGARMVAARCGWWIEERTGPI
jgi:hypothetical protein